MRRDISDWNAKDSVGRGTKASGGRGRGAKSQWRQDLLQKLVRHTLMKTANWHEVFTSSESELKTKYPHQSTVIECTIQKWLLKSPVEGFLKAKAYKWLQYLETHPPKPGSWYPQFAVEVAHKAFRLQGNVATFRNYVSHPSRMKRLPSIFLPAGGLS